MTAPRAVEVGDNVQVTLTGEVLSAYEKHRVDLLRVAVGPFEHSRSEVIEVRADDVTVVEPAEPSHTASGPQELERRVRKSLAYFNEILDPTVGVSMREQFLRDKDPEYWREQDAANRYARQILTRLIRDSFPE